jgi:hypothetical protein
MRCRCVQGPLFDRKCRPLIELIFNLHSIFGFRCRVPLQLASFLRATNGKRGWIRRLDFGLPGPDATRRDNHPCSHRRVADRDRCDQETSQSSGAQPGASSYPESMRTLPRKRQSWRGLPVVADQNGRARYRASRSQPIGEKCPRSAFCCSTSQRSDRNPMSTTSPREVQYPLRIIAWESFALS